MRLRNDVKDNVIARSETTKRSTTKNAFKIYIHISFCIGSERIRG